MKSQVSQLALENLHELDDGLLAAAFIANIRDVIADMNDRPNDDRARAVTIQLTFKPEAHMGDLDRVTLEHKVTAKIPSREGRTCTLTPKRLDGKLQLLFATIGTNAEQPHLPMIDDDD
jgi:hypothetical protein